MAAALLVVPGIVAACLWVAPRGRLGALRQLLAGGAAMVVVGGAWPALIALTPAADRPWVSGTSDNSIVSLIFGYNGLGRLGGQAGGPGLAGGGRGGGGVFGGAARRAAAARREPRRAGRLAARLRARRPASRPRVASRLRRADARTGWLIAVGGAFAGQRGRVQRRAGASSTRTTSRCSRRSRPRSSAPGCAQLARPAGRAARVLAPAAVVAGVATELAVLARPPRPARGGSAPVLAPPAVLAAATLACRRPRGCARSARASRSRRC